MLALAILALALTNGANDTAKGVATLIGSGSLAPRRALTLAMLATLAGSVTALVLGAGLSARFSGMGVVEAGVAGGAGLRGAAALGAALVVGLAAAAGLPISTTHALVGGLVGAALAEVGAESVAWSRVASTMVLPLLVAPVLGAAVAFVVGRFGQTLSVAPPRRHLAHTVSAALVSFARGLNDTPKIAGLWLLADAGAATPTLAVAGAMACGAVFAGRVGDTMARKVTTLDPHTGASANLATSLVVLLASPLALPVSTTHVSVASLLGVSGGAVGPAVKRIAIAWVLTLPLAALVAFLAGTWG